MHSPQETFFTKVFALNGWWKTVISLVPFLIVLVAAGVLTRINSSGIGLVWIGYLMFWLGPVISGIFTVQAIQKRRPQSHLVLLILAFLGVAGAYVFLTFSGCASAVLLNWKP